MHPTQVHANLGWGGEGSAPIAGIGSSPRSRVIGKSSFDDLGDGNQMTEREHTGLLAAIAWE